jgi:hypothetical protein
MTAIGKSLPDFFDVFFYTSPFGRDTFASYKSDFDFTL